MFQQFIDIRNECAKLLERNVNFLDNIKNGTYTSNGGIPLVNNLRGSFDGSALVIEGAQDTVRITDLSVTGLQQFITVDGVSYKVSEFVDNASSGADMYQVLSQLASKYSYCNRTSYSDVLGMMQGMYGEDVNKIKSDLFSVANDEGFITKPSFVAVLQKWFQNGKDGTDNNDPTLDTNNPYTIQSITRVVVQVIATTLTAICTMISSIFAVILGIVSAIVSALCTFAQAVEAEVYYEYDPLVGNLFVEGPVLASPDLSQDTNPYLNISTASLFNAKHICYYQGPGIATFGWKNLQGQTLLNSYLFPFFKPKETLSYLRTQGLTRITETGIQTYNLEFTDIYEIRRLMTSIARMPSTIYYGIDETPNTAEEIVLSLGVGLLLQTLFAYGRNFSSSSHGSLSNVDFPFNPQDKNTNDETLMFNIMGLIYQDYKYPNDTPAEFVKGNKQNGFVDKIANYLSSWISTNIIPNRSSIYCRGTDFSTITVMSNTIHFPMLYAPALANSANVNFTSDTVYFYLDNDNHFTNQSGQSYIGADCLPIDFGVRLPRANLEKLNKLLVAIGLTATVLAVAGTAVSIAIAKRKIGKEALRSSAIAKAREDFLNDPTNTLKRSEYQNMVWKYNTFGKWFNWGTYDSANDWIDISAKDDSNSNDIWNRMFANTSRTDISLEAIYEICARIESLIHTTE